MLDACAPHVRWIDVFCEEGAFDEGQSRRVLEAGRAAGLGLRVHGNQLGPGAGVQLAVELGAASVDHCTYLTAADVDALAGSGTVATLLPATDFCTRQPYPDARRLLDSGATVAVATNCNPGSSNTSSMPFCLGLAVREMRMTVDEALTAATLGGARALRRDDIGHLGVGARGDAVMLEAPSPTHLIYRPGMPLIAETISAGVNAA
jgi:imidazolonepropionase